MTSQALQGGSETLSTRQKTFTPEIALSTCKTVLMTDMLHSALKIVLASDQKASAAETAIPAKKTARPAGALLSSPEPALASPLEGLAANLKTLAGKTAGAALALALLLAGLAIQAGPLAADPTPERYQSVPFAVSSAATPEVLLVVAKDLKMFQHGYPGLTDMDGDSRVDTGFNPGHEYVGYFDSRSCYAYVGNLRVGAAKSIYTYGDASGYYLRVGDAIEDQSQEAINQARPATLKSYVPSPRSPFGVCSVPGGRRVSYNGQGTFSGNWLNYIATSRMDAIRKVLYGGKRKIDTAKRTVLEPSFVPPDSTVWGTEIRSDDTWMELTPLSAYHDITKFTPWAKPASKKGHFVARGSDLGPNNKAFGALRVLKNAGKASFNVGGKDFVGAVITVTDPGNKGYARYWDWILVNRPLPDDQVLTAAARQTVEVYNLSVEVCKPGQIGRFEGCDTFPGATDSPDDDAFKPSGLLQRYGAGATQMSFGLLTGHFGNRGAIHEYNQTDSFSNHTEGGVLRNQIGPVMGTAPPASSPDAFVPAIDARTGQILKNGLIGNLDNLMIAGRKRDVPPVPEIGDPWMISQRYFNSYTWGNPLGEMLYEGVRYLAGASSPTPLFTAYADQDIPGSDNLLLTSFRGSGSWTKRRPKSVASPCAKPVILLISDVATDYDGNSMGTDLSRPLLPNIKLPASLTSANVPNAFNTATYLSSITKLEGLSTTGSVKYIFSEGPAGNCLPKPLSKGLASVNGLCPQNPTSQGTYSVAAAAWYAHIHDFNLSSDPGRSPTGADIYAVSLSPAFPELSFAVKDAAGRNAKNVVINPTNITAYLPNRFLSFLNYFVIDWDTDRNGVLFHAVIKVNFSDLDRGGDWEGDGQVTYEIDLLTDSATPASMRESAPVQIDSGETAELRRDDKWHRFKNPDNADSASDFIDIQSSQVKALRIHSSWTTAGTEVGLAMGYTISGTTRDGTYLDLTMNQAQNGQAVALPTSSSLTPKGCPYAGGPTSGAEGCGKKVNNIKSHARAFSFGTGTDVQLLPSTMWLAAKYGGFTDRNNNGVPDPGEWEDENGEPKNLFQARNLAELPGQLEGAFSSISSSVSTGTATSASMNSVMGGGVSVHTAYYPQYVSPKDASERLAWVGTVYALFVDKWANLREDSDSDGQLTLATGPSGDDGDHIVTFNSVSNPPAPMDQPKCFKPGSPITRCDDEFGNDNPFPVQGAGGAPGTIHHLNTLWDAGRWLAELDGLNATPKLLAGSRPWGAAATTSSGQRRVYFASPYSSSLELFDTSTASMTALEKLLIHDNWASYLPLPAGVQATKKALSRKLVEYALGADVPEWRSRTAFNPWPGGPARVVWRMGDVINSKPIVVGPPASNFDILYGDASYAAFRAQMGPRRQMVYFGANDGMLHAINAGFLGNLSTGRTSYSIDGPASPLTGAPAARHQLGAEVWALIPGAALPKLSFLASPSYTHAYMVDMKPLVADIKIQGQWRTILIGGLRLGGRPIDNPSGEKPLNSEIFCLDITDPEAEPKLLWRFDAYELGLSVGLPTLVSSGGKFYAVLPSGPSTDAIENGKVSFGSLSPYDGVSEKRARLIVLDAATGALQNTGERLMVPESEGRSFFNDPFLPKAFDDDPTDDTWNDHVVYYGLTISRELATCLDKGAVYRLRMVDPATWESLPPSSWALERLISVDRPVTGAVNATVDARGNNWVVFATGRLWGAQDLTPCSSAPNPALCQANHEQYLYGVKEEISPDTRRMAFTDLTPKSSAIIDLTGRIVWSDGSVTLEGSPSSPQSYASIAGEVMSGTSIGYKRKLDMGRLLKPGQKHDFEVSFTQPKLLSLGNGRSLVAFTTFEPRGAASLCGERGDSYMYILDTFTGLASPALAGLFADAGSSVPGQPKIISGGMHTGNEINTEAIIFVGDGVISISTSSADNSHYVKRLPFETTQGSSIISWREAVSAGYTMSKDSMTLGIDPEALP